MLARAALSGAALALAGCAAPPGAVADRPAARPVVQVAAVGGLALSGVWPRLAASAGQQLDLDVQTVAAAPKEGVVPAFARGQAQLLLIHASDEAMGLEAAGLAGPARVWAWNEHVVIGPQADPAGVAGAPDGQQALQRIADARSPFIALRDPGSYGVVQRLWRRAGVRPDAAWVRMDTGPRPQAVLQLAQAQQAYVVAGHIPFAFGKMAAPGMRVLLRGDPQMRRPYVVLAPGPAHPAGAAQRAQAQRLADWLVSPAGQAALQAADAQAGGPWLFPRASVAPWLKEPA